ncbi:MAG: hypothetical protein ACREIC_26215 [Limisphaerales bacterium]
MTPASGIHDGCRLRQPSNALCATSSKARAGGGLNWEMLAIGIFVVFSFAALVFAGYIIWVKCASPSPF